MTERRGRFIKYDKQRVLEEIVAGKKSASQIAVAYGITRDMVYSLKHAAKKHKLIKDPAQRLSDLDPVDPRVRHEGSARDILALAKEFRDGEISELDFYQQIQRILFA